MSRLNVRIAALLLALSPLAAVFAARPLVVGISESFPAANKSAKVMVNASYADAVARGGHVPVVISRFGTDEQFDVLVSKLDVLILTGGEDVDPARYNAAKSPKLGTVNAPRDDFDFRLLDAARRRNLPVIGICRGCQLLNIAFGGTLWQDIPSEFPVKDVQHRNVYHRISIEPNSRFARVTGVTNALVNSYHHQAVKAVGSGFTATAKASDGVIEALEHENGVWLGVQWHPEQMTADGGIMNALFRDLVEKSMK